MTIAIVQTAFLGDVLLTLPLCVAIRRQMPDARIIFITTPVAAAFVDGLGFADDVVAFDKRGQHRTGKGLRALVAERCANVDVAFVPHTSFRTMRLVRAMKPRSIVTFNNTWTRWLRNARVLRYPQELHDADRQLHLLTGANERPLTKESVGPIRLFTDADRKGFTGDDGESPALPGPYVVLAPGTVWPTKQWPLAYVNALAQQLAAEGMRVVVVGDAAVQGGVASHANIVDLAGRTSLRQAAAVIAGAAVVVANDSAPLHVASLQGIPVVGIFGPTVREFGFGPFGPYARIVEQTDLACRPCSNHGSKKCPIRTHVCMKSITPERVHGIVVDVVNKSMG